MKELFEFLTKLKELISIAVDKEIEEGGWYEYSICLDCMKLVKYAVGFNAPEHDDRLMEKIKSKVEKDIAKHKGHTLIVLREEAFTECNKLCEYLLKKLEEITKGCRLTEER